MIEYSAYGLAVHATAELAGLRAGPSDGPEVRVDFGLTDTLATPVESAVRQTWETLWRTDDGGWHFRFDHPGGIDGWTLHAKRAGSGATLTVRRTEAIPHADVAAVVETIGLATTLHLLGVPVLHGCAVTVGTRAILLLGDPGTGKSTAAAALVSAGHRILSDDVAALEDISVLPGPTRLRVNADTARALGWDALPRVFETKLLGDKRYVEAGDDTPRPLSAIYVLGPRAALTSATRLHGAEALGAVLSNVYGRRLLVASDNARLLESWTAVATEVPIGRLHIRDGLTSTAEFVGFVQTDLS